MRRFAIVFWLLCFFLVRVCVCVRVCIHHLHTFVKAPIMMMICSLQWFYLDDLISLLSVGRRRRRKKSSLPSTHSIPARFFHFSCFFCCHDAAAIHALTKQCCHDFPQRWSDTAPQTRVTPSTTDMHTCMHPNTHPFSMLCGSLWFCIMTRRGHTHIDTR